MKTVITADAAIIGAGPVGCVAALCMAEAGASVVLLEQHGNGAAPRFSGEWIHPPGLAVLKDLGLMDLLDNRSNFFPSRGFIFHNPSPPEQTLLPYPNGGAGLSYDFKKFIPKLREAACAHPRIRFIAPARARCSRGDDVTITDSNGSEIVAPIVIGADGRFSRLRTLSSSDQPRLVSVMAVVRLENAALPEEGFGHVFATRLGPGLAYRITQDALRLCVDLPLNMNRVECLERLARLAPELPATLGQALTCAIEKGEVRFAPAHVLSRTHYGQTRYVLIGDASGLSHPITASGLTLGFQDAQCLARSRSLATYRRTRLRQTLVPEVLGNLLYATLSRTDNGALNVRQSMSEMWGDAGHRDLMVRILTAEEVRLPVFLHVLARVLLNARSRRIASSDMKSFPWWLIAPPFQALAQHMRGWITTW